MVGAVLVKDGRVVARGYHRKFGGAHAEVDCLRTYHGDRSSTTLYVNLEPCSYHGKTPPCTDLILREGIPRVVIAMKDPNPLVAGRGIRRLRRAGVDVVTGVLQQEARELNRFFVTHITMGRPYIHLKVAQSLDGKIADRHGDARWISSLQSRILVHRWRAQHDVVLVGAGTIMVDDPSLTVRLAKGRDPAVVILDGRFRVPVSSKVLGSAGRRRVFLCVGKRAAHEHQRKVSVLRKAGVEVVEFPDPRGIIALKHILRFLYAQDMGSVLVEGGGIVFGSFVQQRLVDELSVFVAPRIIGMGTNAFVTEGPGSALGRLMALPSGRDVLIKGFTR
jgi:diaminohydroxyphosphoribosylaminopyrimidine deaminase/5-amino-6-(5-phosphoribosylamino)uracil reductase